jgi:hypothetical protein
MLLIAGVVVIVAAGVAFTMRPKSPPGPAHVVAAPAKLGAYVKDQKLADGMGAATLKAEIVANSGGEARNVVDAVYEETTSGTASGPEIILFIGGNLSGTSPQSFMTSFTGKLKGAVPTNAGSLGGDAACVPSIAGHPAECAWADNNTFGVIASPTLSAPRLGSELRAMRPLVEHPVT